MAVAIADGLEGIPLADRRREGGEEVIAERRVAAFLLDRLVDLAGRGAGRFVVPRGVQRVELVLQEDLPVRLLDHAEAGRHHLDLALRRAVAHVVEGDPGRPEPLAERRPVGRQAGKHEAAVGFYSRGSLDVAVFVARREARALIALVERDRLAAAVGVELPGMVGADDALADIAASVAVEHGAAMRAAVVEHAHRAVGMADHDHRLAADLPRPVVADSRHLALVPDIGPDLVEEALHLELENRRLGIDAVVNPIRLHRLGDIQAAICSHLDLPPSYYYR